MISYVLLGWLAGAAPSGAFALVLGNNQALPESGYGPLRYADDDALRFAEFFRRQGAHVELLVAPDPDTVERLGQVPRAAIPTYAGLVAALDRLQAALERAEGQDRQVYIYLSGHGSVSASDAYFHLVDRPLYRADLHRLILSKLPRERLHLIVDSCHAYFLVNARGRRAAVALGDENLAQYPDVGVLLSTSDAREVHEWDGFQAGVFSYQVLGALQGAADLDLDGVIRYADVQGYVMAANQNVENPRARVKPLFRPPLGLPQAPLIQLKAGTPRAQVPEDISGKLRVVDGRGYPLLDLNKPNGAVVWLQVEPEAQLWAEERVAVVGPQQVFAWVPEAESPLLARARGSVADDFRKNMFTQPLTMDYLKGLEAGALGTSVAEPRAPRRWYQDPLTVGLAGASAAALATGGVFLGLYVHENKGAQRRPIDAQVVESQQQAPRWAAGAWAGLGVGLGLAVGAGLNALLGRTEAEPYWSAALTEDGFTVGWGGPLP